MNIERILLIEDEESHVKLFKRNINRLRPHIEIFTAANGADGLALLKTIPRENLLVLLDLNIPVLSGFEVLEQIDQDANLRLIPVVILTTSDYTKDLDLAKKYGVLNYLVKPVSSDQLNAIFDL